MSVKDLAKESDTGWWFVVDEKKKGPVSEAHVRELFMSGQISLETLMWKQGLIEWAPLVSLHEFESLSYELPPPVPVPPTVAVPITLYQGTWRRFFARTFDVWWEILLVSLLVGYVLGTYSAVFVEWINGSSSALLFGIFVLPLAMLLDAAVFSVAGNTPGKFLLGLSVVTVKFERPDFATYLKRNMNVYIQGLALGIPLINLFTMVTQSKRIKDTGNTSYDLGGDTRVVAKPLRWYLLLAFVILYLTLFAVQSVLKEVDRRDTQTALQETVQGTYQWTNPITGAVATVSAKWHVTPGANNTIQASTYSFSEITDKAHVIFGYEAAPSSLDIGEYVGLLKRSLNDQINFSSNASFFVRDNVDMWTSSGVSKADTSIIFQVTVRKGLNGYWRTVTVQAKPYDYSTDMIEKLEASLFATVGNSY